MLNCGCKMAGMQPVPLARMPQLAGALCPRRLALCPRRPALCPRRTDTEAGDCWRATPTRIGDAHDAHISHYLGCTAVALD